MPARGNVRLQLTLPHAMQTHVEVLDLQGELSQGHQYGCALDLNGDGIDITPRTGSTVFFDVDLDGFFERTAWAAPTDGMLVIDLAANIVFDVNGNLTPESYIGDGIIDQAEASLKANCPLPRVGAPGELKGVAVFLAADASNYITGQTIVVDGGRTIA